jgi:hypothetical protein
MKKPQSNVGPHPRISCGTLFYFQEVMLSSPFQKKYTLNGKLHRMSILLIVEEFRCVLQNHTFNALQTDGAQVLQWKLWGAPLNKLDHLSFYIHSVSKINVKILV